MCYIPITVTFSLKYGSNHLPTYSSLIGWLVSKGIAFIKYLLICKKCISFDALSHTYCGLNKQLSMKFKMLINIDIAKIDGIFLFKSLKPIIYPANEC